MRAALLLACLTTPLLAAPPAGELHEIVFFDGQRAGHQSLTVKAEEGGKFVRTTATLDLTLRRFGTVVRVRREEGTRATTDGKVFATFMVQGQAGGKPTSLNGTVIDGKLLVRYQPLGTERWVPWDEAALTPWQQVEQFAKRKPKAGDTFTFTRYEPTYNTILTVRVSVKARERVDVMGKVRDLLRVELVPDALEAGKVRVVPPRATWWLDDDFRPAKRQTTLEGLGSLTLVRTEKDRAMAPVTSTAPDIGRAAFAPLNRMIARPYDTRRARYRITVRDEADVTGLFPSDDHQTVTSAKDGKVELTVQPASDAGEEKAKPEHLASNAFIDHDDDRVKELARRAVGDESDAWKKAVRIERFVRTLIVNDNAAALVPASKIARTPRGDCRHHAFLTAALGRSAGLPTRTAIGFLYVHRGAPVFGFHTWTEVLIDGRWRGIDSTLGRGGVSAAHVKVTDHSWHDVTSLAPLLPAQRVVGKVRFELLAVE